MNMLFNRSLFVLCATLVGMACIPVQSAVIFIDDLEAYTPGTGNFTPEGTSWYDTYNAVTIADENTATPFGASNHYMILNTGSNFYRTDSLSQSASGLATYSFDFVDASTAASGPDGIRFGIGSGDLNSSKAYTAWFINDGVLTTAENTSLVSGALPTLEEDKVYTAFVMYNGSGSTQLINGAGVATVSAGQSALFFYDQVGETLLDAGRFGHTSSVTPTGFLLRNFSSGDNELYIDNISLEDSLTVVPEPGSMYLIMLGSVVLVWARFSRR
ncbi:PEP-CTERM sorting domain-containing protein [Kiritimatiellota bacterium B12222]|nr:PEP-CTERM sorting domain-containing protein [Kiritimatiellota bacterium B12222]